MKGKTKTGQKMLKL